MRVPSKRKAISPILATVILIAITLIAAVAIATFVFGIFGSSASPATYSIVTSSVQCVGVGGTVPGSGDLHAYTGSLAANGACAMTVDNSGSASGTIISTGPSNDFAFVTVAGAAATSVVVPAGSSAVVYVTLSYGAGKATSGQTITAYLVPGGSAANLPFTIVAP